MLKLSIELGLIEHDMAERGRLLRLRVSLPDKPGMLHTLTGIISSEGANVLEVVHNRTYAKIPGYVEITVVMEVRGCPHAVAPQLETNIYEFL